MIEKIKSKTNAKTWIIVALLIIVVVFGYFFSTSYKAYNIIKNNYDGFNYPNTIQFHHGIYVNAENNSDDFIVAQVSAENAYKQRIYSTIIADNDFMTEFGYDYDFFDGKYISPVIVNFLISLDW